MSKKKVTCIMCQRKVPMIEAENPPGLTEDMKGLGIVACEECLSPKVYLSLEHGRPNPQMSMDEIGFGDPGPVLGPFDTINFIYGGYLHIVSGYEIDEHLPIHDGCLYYDGTYYGDLVALTRKEIGERRKIKKLDPNKINSPHYVRIEKNGGRTTFHHLKPIFPAVFKKKSIKRDEEGKLVPICGDCTEAYLLLKNFPGERFYPAEGKNWSPCGVVGCEEVADSEFAIPDNYSEMIFYKDEIKKGG